MALSRIKKGDTVVIVSGAERGKTGTVTSVDPKKGTALVGGCNKHKKAVRPSDRSAGGLIDREMPIRLCKLMPYDADKKVGTRVKTAEQEGKKARVSVKSGKNI